MVVRNHRIGQSRPGHLCVRVLSRSTSLVRSSAGDAGICNILYSRGFISIRRCITIVPVVHVSQLAWVYATTNVKIQIDVFCRIVAGYIWEGKVLANIWFFDLGYISGIKGLAFAQDLKLGIYCNVSEQ